MAYSVLVAGSSRPRQRLLVGNMLIRKGTAVYLSKVMFPRPRRPPPAEPFQSFYNTRLVRWFLDNLTVLFRHPPE